MVATHVINAIWSDVSHHEPLSITCGWRVKPSIQPLPSLKLSQLNDTHKASHTVSLSGYSPTRTHNVTRTHAPHTSFSKTRSSRYRFGSFFLAAISPVISDDSLFSRTTPSSLPLLLLWGFLLSLHWSAWQSPPKETPNEETSSCGRESRRSSKSGRMRV
jgi:hypothetical protein